MSTPSDADLETAVRLLLAHSDGDLDIRDAILRDNPDSVLPLLTLLARMLGRAPGLATQETAERVVAALKEVDRPQLGRAARRAAERAQRRCKTH